MAAAAPIFTAAGAAVPCSAFRRGAGRCAAAAAAAAAAREFDDDGLKATTATAAATALPIVANSLPPRRVVAEYLYLGGSGTDMRSVTRVVEVPGGALGTAAASLEAVIAALPLIAVDGATTRQGGGAQGGHCSALFLKPRSAWPDPLRGGGALLVLCEAYSPPALGSGDGRFSTPASPPSSSSKHPALSPHPTNNRAFAERAARAAAREEPLFAVTQQYLLCEGDGRPLGWTVDGPPQASCYGSPDGGGGGGIGEAGFSFPWNGNGTPSPPTNPSEPSRKGRAVADAHLAACLAAGLALTGCRAEEASGQWSFSLGPLPPLEAADQLWAARWLLRAVAAGGQEPLAVVTDALPQHLARFEGRWDGNGCRVKFSTRATRDTSGGGRRALRNAIERLAAAHPAHMMVYGARAALRCEKAAKRKRREEEEEGATSLVSPLPAAPTTLTAEEANVVAPAPPPPPLTPPLQPHRFAGVEDHGALLRIPAAVALHGRGHLEDRRPAGGCDPYLAFTLLLCTTLGLPLPLLPGDATSMNANNVRKAAGAKRARCGGDDNGGAFVFRRTVVVARPIASVVASGSGEDQCPIRNINANANDVAAVPAASLLACDEQVAESAQGEGDEGVEDINGDGAAVAAAAAENSDLSDTDVRSSALLLAEDDDGEDDDGVSTPLTPSRDAADGGATTVAGPDNREASSSPKRGHGDLDDDATSSSSNGGGN